MFHTKRQIQWRFTEEGNPTEDAWKRKCDKSLCIDVNGERYSQGENSPRFIIEYLGTNSADKRTIYRVTAKHGVRMPIPKRSSILRCQRII